MVKKFRLLLVRHYLAIILSILVGSIYVGPHVWFMVAHHDVYRGIPLMQVDNEDFYLARMQEIIDGYPLLGSPAYFEYKNQPPISPPTSELLYALPTLMLGIPVVVTVTASKFLFPSVLFLLVYFLIYRLLGQENKTPNKISAIAGALFVVLGYDLVSYRHAFLLLTGAVESTKWLIWTRPVNPVTGAVFLFSFLLFFWSVIQRTKLYKISIVGAGFFLALMFASYFFSWGVALSILAMAGLVYLIRRDFQTVARIIYTLILGVVISSPYWYLSWQAKQNPWYEHTLLKSGIFYTHYPLFNKVLLVSLAIYLIFLTFKFFKQTNQSRFEHNDLLVFIFLAGGLFALNQQVITGMTVWPFHFVQYTIPLSIIAMITVLHRSMYERWRALWVGSIGVIVIMSCWFGIYTQYGTYAHALERNISIQSYAPVFDWFNQQEKDCVVLVVGDERWFTALNGMILAFTHCNQYGNTWAYSLLPQERVHHSYLVNLRLRGVPAEGFADYLEANSPEARSYLFSNWAGLYDVSVFPDFKDLELSKRLQIFPEEYLQFLDKDLKTELGKYRLDFIVSLGDLPPQIKEQLPHIGLQQVINGIFIYKY